jgi:UDP-N-acetylglucosamine 2-epimerase (non-hydrolysing)
VREATRAIEGLERVHLTPPLDYLTFVHLMQRAAIVLTDSGGVLEEAASLGRPVLVLRKHTERPEACEIGAAEIVGTDVARIVSAAARVLEAGAAGSQDERPNPYGDGHAAERIALAISRWFAGRQPLLDAAETFVFS